MNEAIVEIWNKTVKPNDFVYILGDFSLNPKWAEVYGPKLNGTKFLLAGNHDEIFPGKLHNKPEKTKKMIDRYTKAGFIVFPGLYEKLTLSRPRWGILGWLGLKKKYIVQLSHFPFRPSEKAGNLERKDVRYLDQRPKDEGQILLHGHSHCYYRKNGRQIDVGFDGDLRLWSESDIIKLIEDKRDYIPSPITEFYKSKKNER